MYIENVKQEHGSILGKLCIRVFKRNTSFHINQCFHNKITSIYLKWSSNYNLLYKKLVFTLHHI